MPYHPQQFFFGDAVMATQRFEIVEGPGELKFVIGLLERDRRLQFTVKVNSFTVRPEVILQGILAEDGSKTKWLIQGYILEGSVLVAHSTPFKGYYDLRRRTGWIEY